MISAPVLGHKECRKLDERTLGGRGRCNESACDLHTVITALIGYVGGHWSGSNRHIRTGLLAPNKPVFGRDKLIYRFFCLFIEPSLLSMVCSDARPMNGSRLRGGGRAQAHINVATESSGGDSHLIYFFKGSAASASL